MAERLRPLWDMQWKSIDEAVKYLFLVNSGGAIAVLGYLGTDSTKIHAPWAGMAVVLFCLGIVFVGVIRFMLFHRSRSLFESLRQELKACAKGEMKVEAVSSKDEERSEARIREILCGYAALSCFILGPICGAIGFYKQGIPGGN